VRPDRVEILGVRTAGCAAARFFLLPTIAVVFGKKVSVEDGEIEVAARGCGEKHGYDMGKLNRGGNKCIKGESFAKIM
jgi:hypothetical protein